ncbi:MAG TPA: hypothetical protein VMU22_13445 [Rhizomicrobium sp.]|nr:hypothetical protein [Rhizomicrobium sp.]
MAGPNSLDGKSGLSGSEQWADSTFDTAREIGNEIGNTLKDRAEDVAEEQKNAGAARISSVAEAVHHAADSVSTEIPQAGNVLHRGARQLERAAQAIEENSVAELLEKANDAAREQPAMVIGASILAGFATARLLRAKPLR